MNHTTIYKNLTVACFGLAAWATASSSTAKAQCFASLTTRQGIVRPNAKALIPRAALQAGVRSEGPALVPRAQGPAIVGLWNAVFTSGGQIADEGFDLWHADGTEVLNDTPPPATGNVCLGTWVQVGTAFKLKHLSWSFDENGNLNGMFIIRETVTVDASGDSYTGTFTVDGYDLTGAPTFHQAGQLTGERITVDNF